MVRFCAYDDKPVRAVAEMKKNDPDEPNTFGKGTPSSGYYHVGGGPTAGCGRQFLQEHETYTEGESDLNPPSR